MKKTKLLMPLAGIAAIGAVAPIVTLASCNKGGDKKEEVVPSAEDKAFLTKINDYMAQKDGKISCHKAVSVLKDLGYDVTTYRLSNIVFQFAYDASAKKFIIMKGDEVAAAPTGYSMTNTQSVFLFTTSYDKTSKYGQYLLDNYELPTNATTLEVATSIDVGNNTIANITYTADSSTAKNILLRTNSEVVKIDAKNDTVFHMGNANNLEVAGSASKPDFYEVGWVGYMKSKDIKLNTYVIDKAEGAQIDILEPATTTIGSIVSGTVTIRTADLDSAGTQPGQKLTPTNVGDATTLVGKGSTTEFLRLSADVTLRGTQVFSVTANATIVLDLAGKKLTLNDTVTVGTTEATFPITISQGKLIVIDSSSTKAGTVKAVDNYIKVQGTAASTQSAELCIEGGTFDFTGVAGKRSGFIQVGENTTTPAQIAYSTFTMYGGTIKTQLPSSPATESKHDNQANGIYIQANTYVQITGGTIQSSEVCIRGSGTFADAHASYIDITGGTFKQTSSTYGECIFQPQGGTLNITGGTFEGRGCIASKNGNVHIGGGYFHATGKNQDLTPTGGTQEHDIDGSVLCMELTAAQYGINPSITVHNATLYSEKSYILQVYGTASTAQRIHLAEADFFGGVYYYGAEAGTGSATGYNGIRVATAVQNDIRISQYAGSWVKVS